MWRSQKMLMQLYRGSGDTQNQIVPSQITVFENNMFTMWISETKNPLVDYCIDRLHQFAMTNNKKLHIITSTEDISTCVQRLIDFGIPNSGLDETHVDNLVWLKENYLRFSPTEPNGMRIQHLSDILRYLLLATFGGMWIDASSILTSEIPNWNGTYDMVVPSKLDFSDIYNTFFPKEPRYLKQLLGMKEEAYDDDHIQLASITENWFIWCKPICLPMSLWAYYTLSQARSIMTSDMTQKTQVLRNLNLPDPRQLDLRMQITTNYLWTYSVFAYVCRILNAHIDNVEDLFENDNPLETLMTFSQTSSKVGLLPFASHDNCFTIKPWLFKMTTSCREYLKSNGFTEKTIGIEIERLLADSE
tara:strand:- start:426 stop:1505 length:1080 start_codon:yes stop_codon:yes gene_type:complete